MSAARWENLGMAVVVVAATILRAHFPGRVEVGEIVLLSAGLLLAQGLVRDVLKTLLVRRASAPARITCVCAESTLGASGILLGIVLLCATSAHVVAVPSFAWPVAIGAVLVFGFATRHLVIDYRARRLRWLPNHDGLVVWNA